MELMRFMGWSWPDLKRTPRSVVDAALLRMEAHARASERRGRGR